MGGTTVGTDTVPRHECHVNARRGALGATPIVHTILLPPQEGLVPPGAITKENVVWAYETLVRCLPPCRALCFVAQFVCSPKAMLCPKPVCHSPPITCHCTPRRRPPLPPHTQISRTVRLSKKDEMKVLVPWADFLNHSPER